MELLDFKRKESAGGAPVFDLKETPGGVPLLKYPLLDRAQVAEHGFTTRAGGVSRGMFSSLNLSYTRGDDRAAVDENFRRVAVSMNAVPGDFVLSDQTHTVNVRRVGAADRGKGIVRKRDYRDVDGMITDEPGIVLATFYADCVPLFFIDPVHHAVGLSHSGWRGTVSRMGRVTIEAMEAEFGSRPSELYCAVGPSICQDCYEVGEDVAGRFLEEFPDGGSALLRPSAPGKYRLNLWYANERVLLEAGVLPEHLAVTDICTCCNPRLLFSHRASGGKRGNLGAFLKLRD